MINIIGGNIAGLSTAILLKEKDPDLPVAIYEKRIWNKPCGGAISNEFDNYLEKKNIVLNERHYTKDFIIGTWNGKHETLPCPFVITNRLDMQQALIRKAKSLDVPVHFKTVKKRDDKTFTPQTVIATGYSSIGHYLLNRNWEDNDLALTVRYDGQVKGCNVPELQAIIFDNKRCGYGWLFKGEGDQLNVGYGCRFRDTDPYQRYREFLTIINHLLDIDLTYETVTPRGWIIPMPMPTKRSYPIVNTIKQGNKRRVFIGVGDIIGVAHPVLGAGIETSWQSSQILANCYGMSTKTIDVNRYQQLLTINRKKTVQRRKDYWNSRFIRSKWYGWLPAKDWFNYNILVRRAGKMLKITSKHPFFMVPITQLINT